jgi:phosphatidyl-myo-inositol dimannoside synthase
MIQSFMRLAIYSSDLTPGNRHLMPWRMVLEIGQAACRAGHQATVLSGRREATGKRWDCHGCPVEEVAKPYSQGASEHLRQIVRREGFDVLFWPVAWCSARRQGDLLTRLSMPIVWYIPGACYSVRQVMRAVPDVGGRSSLPFLVQSVYPKRHLLKRLRRPATDFMITASPFNRSAVCRAGWPADHVFAIPPGRPREHTPANGDEPIVFQSIRDRLKGRPFYLFLGPPTGIRGTRQLLEAFDRLAGQRSDACLVCLFRSDPGADLAGIRRRTEGGAYAERILCVWESVGNADLYAFLEACYAVVLPFLLVPSEIPLAVIEAAGHGKPVITTGPGGTADFVREFGLAVPSGCSKALANAMLRLLDDRQLHAHKCDAARRIYAAHPIWEDVAQAWVAVAQRAINIDNE